MEETNTKGKSKIAGFFGAIGRFIKRHKKLSVFLLIVLIAGGVALAFFSNTSPDAGAMAMPQTVSLEKMNLEQFVSATGTLQSGTTREVTSSLSYKIAEIYVAEGDSVEAGQLLARLDTSELDDDIAEARKNIAQAEEQDALSLAQAQRKLQDAINTRDINWNKNNQAVQETVPALNAANADLNAANSTLAAAQGAVDTWQAQLNEATTALQGIDSSDPNFTYYATAQQTAQDNLAAAQPALEAAITAQASAADAAYIAQSAYDKAVEARDTAHRNDSINVENAQDSVNSQSLKDSAASYRTQLQSYLDDKDDCQITAPIAGTITAMGAEVGQSAGSGGMGAGTTTTTALFTIEDTNRLEITTSIPEYDTVTLTTGMQATITSDALDDTEWRGVVKSISPKATDDSGNFTVVVEITSPVGELAIGMSGKVNIITKSKTDVFAVPYDAVTTNAAGQNVIYVLDVDMQQGQSEQQTPPQGQQPPQQMPQQGDDADADTQPSGRAIVVTTGMETDYYIEVQSDELQEGMVVLADPESKNVSAPSGDMGGFRVGGF